MAREKIFFCLPDFSGGAEKVTLTLLSAFAANKKYYLCCT